MAAGRAGLSFALCVALGACQGRVISEKGTGGTGTNATGTGGAGAPGAVTTSGGVRAEGGDDATGETGGATTPGGAAGQAAGGTETAGDGGAAPGGRSDAGRSGATGSGGSSTISSLSEREKEILAPLGTDDATIAGTNGGDLLVLGRKVVGAKAYALCRCGLSPDGMPDDPARLEICAAAETDSSLFGRPDKTRCIEEGMASVPGFEDYLRCVIEWYRDDGVGRLACVDSEDHSRPALMCQPSDEGRRLIDGCIVVHYCADDERVEGARCDGVFQCSDQSDELGCFDVHGRDWFSCDGELVRPAILCRATTCGLQKTPPVCDRTMPDRYLCNDGGNVSVDTVCDRALDCADGSDERYCLR